VMVGQIPWQAHFGSMINWPITLDGCLSPARGKIDQYEFNCRDKASINAKLPFGSGNPYVVTVSPHKGHRNKGIQVTVQFNDHKVSGQFHRHAANKPKGIWIGSNRTNQGSDATKAWRQFVSHFGITVGKQGKTIPVYLDFYNNLLIVIRRRPSISGTPEGYA